MEFPVGLGGVTLVAAAVIWLLVFVPGFTQRSQITETSRYVIQQQREADKKIPMTKDEQLRRLINTQRSFSVVFGISFLAAVGLWIYQVANPGFSFLAGTLTVVAVGALILSRAAARQATRIAANMHANRVSVRSKAAKAMSRQDRREWTPNPLPAPLASLPKPEQISEPMADVIHISTPKKVLSGSEIDQILARRRAI
jgi:hypothetical protein